MANILYYDIVVSEFEPQSRFYVYFGTMTLEKGMNPFLPCYGLEVPLVLFYKDIYVLKILVILFVYFLV